MAFVVQEFPHLIKYMGSKTQILDFVISGINEVHEPNQKVCDLFSGSCSLAGTLRNQAQVISNDIQQYSSVLAYAYLASVAWDKYPNILEDIIESATYQVNRMKNRYPNLRFEYKEDITLDNFTKVEELQRALSLNPDFPEKDYHLFAKNYSGTYWSYEQCLWIDAIRAAAESYKNDVVFYIILTSLMYAMSYNSQSTGHYAQFRQANDETSMLDILNYRRREIVPYFTRKFLELKDFLSSANCFEPIVTTLDYQDCLGTIASGTTVYADPPYCFVHYSRFYHVLETLVKYDYPQLKYTGRYRTDRHQSHFCIRTLVEPAFTEMFRKIRQQSANLVLSYSNTGMIELDRLANVANDCLSSDYDVKIKYLDHLHSTMGRKNDKSRDVTEALVLAKRK